MLRYRFLTLIFLAIVMVFLLSSCGPAPAMAFFATATPAASMPQVNLQREKPVAEQANPTASPIRVPAQVVQATVPAQSPAIVDAKVTADVLNVRVGPGMNHRIMGKLVEGQAVRVEGRSLNNEWAAVRLADGREGWVYSSYLSPNTALASLPVMEAYGGPVISEPKAQPASKPSGRYTLNISISDNQARVNMAGFAAKQDITLRLTVPGEDLAMTVATTTTDPQGSANITFDMPTSWPDGSAITQSQMGLQVLSMDGKLLGKAKITFLLGE